MPSIPSSPVRTCRICGTTFPETLDHFFRDGKGRDGLRTACKACDKARARAWVKANPEQRRDIVRRSDAKRVEQRHAYEAAHREQARARARSWHERYGADSEVRARRQAHAASPAVRAKVRSRYHANPEPRRDATRAWRQANPDRFRAYLRQHYRTNRADYLARNRKRQARLRNAPGVHTAADVRAQLERQQGCCYWCKRVLTQYHVDHVVPLSRGGSNGPENIVVACPFCNLSRKDRLPEEWTQRPFPD